ncbi:hypothetical protein Pth03_05320 [Planotetraspora thailandica]|uniref:ABC transporter permease n=1 Tax=Planotetraspora thailandica TaxID=487172 RepID=A0A8J3XWV4_9ACTN|nr:ABC transporter permease subunit [Planotetraspora thailandica]GII52143.1 hypothetical protein Pth03_05320 [Planotetraspora thailandica]
MTVVTPYRSAVRGARDGFAQLLHAEWTKFRTVRGWVAAMAVVAPVVIALGLFSAAGNSSSCSDGPKVVPCPAVPLGPGGEAVSDSFTFMHRPLGEGGGITARVTGMTGIITYPPPNHDQIVNGLVPWAKAGIIIKESTRQGSAYAAVMVTGHHGVRMQHDFTHDVAGRPASAASPTWLRLTRSGDTITGYESADGVHWSTIGSVRLPGLPATVQAGLFVTSPADLTVKPNAVGGSIAQARFTQATAVFDNVDLRGAPPGTVWSDDQIGQSGTTQWEQEHKPAGVVSSGGTFTVTGSGDIAPIGQEAGQSIEHTLTGGLVALIVVMIVAVMFVTAEYRRGLIRTTLLASPRRGRALAAKALVIGVLAFAAGLVAAVVTVPPATRILRSNGNYVLPVSLLTELRVMVGTAALFAVAAVGALALGALFRRGVAAAVTAMVVVVVPAVLATASVLPLEVSRWLLRLTPAAGFAVQQSIPDYPQVIGDYSPQAGYYPLPPWAGFAVLCGYAALALALAVLRMRRRDA